MSEFNAVAHATFSPTRCFFCMEFQGPFIDTHVENDAIGHIYICGPSESRSGCVGQMASKFGGLTDLDAQRLRQELAEAKTQIEQLERDRTVTMTYEDLHRMFVASKPREKVEA